MSEAKIPDWICEKCKGVKRGFIATATSNYCQCARPLQGPTETHYLEKLMHDGLKEIGWPTPHVKLPHVEPKAAPTKKPAPSFKLTVASNGWIIRTSTGELIVCNEWIAFAKWCRNFLHIASGAE